mmetsp:Transcript_17535/g.37731  ORF Transcript_17535/g.37731 Transcript_17535/m.37731 type:complete len:205 (-) Transcript_17535:1579-2193(-)
MPMRHLSGGGGCSSSAWRRNQSRCASGPLSKALTLMVVASARSIGSSGVMHGQSVTSGRAVPHEAHWPPLALGGLRKVHSTHGHSLPAVSKRCHCCCASERPVSVRLMLALGGGRVATISCSVSTQSTTISFSSPQSLMPKSYERVAVCRENQWYEGMSATSALPWYSFCSVRVSRPMETRRTCASSTDFLVPSHVSVRQSGER